MMEQIRAAIEQDCMREYAEEFFAKNGHFTW